MIAILYALNLLLVGSCAIALGIKTRERRVTLSLLQALAGLPLLAVFYGFFSQLGAPDRPGAAAAFFRRGLRGAVAGTGPAAGAPEHRAGA